MFSRMRAECYRTPYGSVQFFQDLARLLANYSSDNVNPELRPERAYEMLAILERSRHPLAVITAQFKQEPPRVLRTPRVMDVFDADTVTEIDIDDCIRREGWTADLAGMQHCRELRRLYLPNCGLTDAQLRFLPDLPKLESIAIGGNNKIGDETARTLAKCRTLKHVELRGSSVSGAGLGHLMHLPLETLDLSFLDLNNEDLKPVARMHSLTALDLGGFWRLNASGLEEISRLPNLEILCLNNTHFNGADLVKHLGSCRWLCWMGLDACKNIPISAVVELQRRLPHLSVFYSVLSFGTWKGCLCRPWAEAENIFDFMRRTVAPGAE